MIKRKRPVLPLLLSFAAVGCGAEEYQSRIIGNTVPLFQYKQELDANLGPEWRKGEVRLRLPAGLTEVPPPKKEERDRRIPNPLPQDLTGVLGGFRGTARGLTSDGKNAETPIFALVLSNRELLASRNPEIKPQDFDRVLINAVAGAAGAGPVSLSALKPITVGGETFEPSLRYEAVSFEAASGTVPMRYDIYLRREPPSLQVAVIFITPKEVDRSNPIRNQIELALQTLRIGSPGGASAAQPSSPAGGSPAF